MLIEGYIFILLQQHLHLLVSLHKVIGHDLYYAKNSCLVEIADKAFSLLGNGQVVAPRKHVRYAMFMLSKAIEPKVLAEAHLGD